MPATAGIVLQGTFDARVNAELRVGALEETVTASGSSPVVDVQNTLTQTVISKDQLEVLPGSRTLKGRAALVPSVIVPSANTGVVAHGSASEDSHSMQDGFKAGNHLVGRGTGRLGIGSTTHSQEAAIEEIVYDVGAQGAEYAFSGVRMNMIPKEAATGHTIFADYYRILDVRFSKTMTLGRNRITALAEFDNIMNMRNVVAVTESFGANWLRPSAVQRGRNVRFGIQYRF